MMASAKATGACPQDHARRAGKGKLLRGRTHHEKWHRGQSEPTPVGLIPARPFAPVTRYLLNCKILSAFLEIATIYAPISPATAKLRHASRRPDHLSQSDVLPHTGGPRSPSFGFIIGSALRNGVFGVLPHPASA